MLRVLIIEDSEADALRILNELYRGGYDPVDERVFTAETVQKALMEKEWDLVVSDFHMPDFTGIDALKIFNSIGLDLPFILVSGMIGEQRAVEALKLGAHDFISKNDLSRFLPAVKRELREAKLRDEQRGYQEALLRHEEVFRNIQIGIHVYRMENIEDDRSLRLIDTNKLAAKYFGLKELDIIGKTIFEIIPEMCDLGLSLQLAQVIRRNESIEFEIKKKAVKEHPAIFFSVMAFPLPGNCVGVAFEDISERKQTEKALRESESRYRAVFNGSAEGILIVDTQTNEFRYANPAIRSMLGLSTQELKELKLEDIYPRNEYENIISEFEIQAQGEKAISNNIPCLRKDGDVIYADIKTSRMTIDGRDCNVLFIKDVTERRLAEQSLIESEERFKAIANTANDAIIMIDDKGNTSYWNPAAERSFGYTYDDICGKNAFELLAPEQLRAEYKQNIPRFAEEGKNKAVGKMMELSALRKDGKEFPVEISMSSIRIKDQWHVLGILRDISERRRLEVQLRQAHKMESIGTLAAGIAHEINTPTQFVGNNIRFLEDSFKDINEVLILLDELIKMETQDETLKQILDKVKVAIDKADTEFLIDEIPKAIEQSKRGVQNVSRIVSAMRSFAHPGTEEKKMANIHKSLESTITVSRNEWKYVADLETHFDPELPLIPCYVGEFNQVMLNLIVNAAQAISEALIRKKEELNPDEKIDVSADSDLKGLIKITTSRKNDMVEIKISDTGIGIPSSARDRVFEPFFTTKDVGEGTGQGLTLAHNVIVEKHRGTINFETEEGKGTTFIITLPINID